MSAGTKVLGIMEATPKEVGVGLATYWGDFKDPWPRGPYKSGTNRGSAPGGTREFLSWRREVKDIAQNRVRWRTLEGDLCSTRNEDD